MPQDDLLTVADIAGLAQIDAVTWRVYVHRRQAPEADGPRDASTGWRPRWRRATVEHWLANRPGQGKRTDLAEARVGRRRQDEAERTATSPTASPRLQAWLATNHAALREVAERLDDERDQLLQLATARGLEDQLAAALDRAGEYNLARPHKLLASGVSMALVLARQLPIADLELAGWLERQWWLYEGFKAVRGGPSV